jgi:ABC-type uncharacterized transport system involved in gliding motility auxiliary subunit
MTSPQRGIRARARTGFRFRVAFVLFSFVMLWGAVALVGNDLLRGRLDLTRDRAYTLSPASQATLDHLHGPILIQVFASRELPSDFRQRREELEDWLAEFEAHSGGKVRVRVEDPGRNEARRRAAEALGVRQVALRSENQESLEIQKGFLGLVVFYGNQKFAFPVLTDLSTFEYDLIVAIKRLTGAVKTVGILEGAEGSRYTVTFPGPGQTPGVGFDANFPTLRGEMDKLFRVVTVEPAPGPIDTVIDLLVVAAPSRLKESEKFRIDQFLMHGKSVLFLTPGMGVNGGDGFSAAPSNNGYEDLLAWYGVGVRPNVLAEPQQAERLPAGDAGLPRPYPYWMVEGFGAFHPDHPVTSRLQSVSFPWASSVEWGAGGQGPLRTEVLVRTSPEAWEETGILALAPRDLSEIQPGPPRSYPLAVLRTGRFTSFYAQDSARALPASQGDARVLVIGNALFATDFYVGLTGAADNLLLLLNAMNHLAQDSDLIPIRSRRLAESPLDPVAARRLKTTLMAFNLVLVPGLIGWLGLWAAYRIRGPRGPVALKRRDARAAAWLWILVLATVLATAAIGISGHGRIDLTRNREFTLDPAALRTVERLPDKVTVRFVASKDLPDEFSRVRARLVDDLRELEARSRGRLRVVFDNPDRDSLARIGALSLGIEEVLFREEARAGVKARKGFFGLALIYRDRKEVLPVLRSVETFEYDFTVRLKRLTGPLKTVGLLEGSYDGSEDRRFQVLPPAGEPVAAPGFDGQFSALAQRLKPLYRLVPLAFPDSALSDASSPEGSTPGTRPRVDVIVVAAPKHLTAAEARGLSQALKSGIPVVYLLPGARIDLSAGIDPVAAAAADTAGEAERFLAEYGITVRRGLHLDPAHAEAVRFGEGPTALPYPWWVRVEGPSLNSENPVTAPLSSLGFPWVSSLTLNREALPSARYEVLASISAAAREVDFDSVQVHTLYPDALPGYGPGSRAGFSRASARPAPVAVLVSAPAFRLAVVSNALFVSDFYAGYVDPENNLQFIQNLLDQVALDPGLIAMRSRPLPDAPLDAERAERLKLLVVGLNLAVGPVLLLGVWAFGNRKKRTKESA